MKKSKILGRKIVSGVLGLAFLFSLMGCGEKQEDFASYGTLNEIKGNEQEDKTQGTTDYKSSGDEIDSSLVEILKTESWIQDGFKIKDVAASANIEYVGSKMNPDDIGSIKVYEGHLAYDFKDEEEGIVNSLFGSTSKKLEEISYQNSTAYLPFLYKYRKLRVELGEEKTKTEIDGKDVVVNDYSTYESAINSNCKDVYKWIDNDEYYIHMYEGSYNGCKFGLILAYSYITKTRYIYFEPICIDEYFPGEEYKTLDISSGYDAAGNVKETDNRCSYFADEVKGMASELLQNCFGMDCSKISLDNDPSIFQWAHSALGGSSVIAINSDFIETPSGKAESEEVLYSHQYTKEDLLTTAMSKNHYYSGAGYYRLAEQEYKLPEGTDFGMYIQNNVINLKDEIETVTDGYAVFINSDYSSKLEFSVNNDDLNFENVYNAGIVKVTSKGIYGADIVQMIQIDKSEENLHFLGFDKIKENAIQELDKNLNLELMGNPQVLEIVRANLSYTKTKGDKEDELICAPCWNFAVKGDSMGAIISINAIDGTFARIIYVPIGV